jgi:triosephosphate isomerase
MEDERVSGLTEAVLAEQLTGSLAGFESTDVNALVIAYEPCWAIGTGLTASTAQAQAAHGFIRQWLAERFGSEQAENLRIQYGGSVTAANAFDLLGMPDIDGALVGGASLKPDDFAAIVAAQNSVIAA